MVYPGMSLSSRQKPKGFCKDSITTASKQPRMNKNIKFSPIAKRDVHCHKSYTTEVWMGGSGCWETVLRHFSLLCRSQIQQWQLPIKVPGCVRAQQETFSYWFSCALMLPASPSLAREQQFGALSTVSQHINELSDARLYVLARKPFYLLCGKGIKYSWISILRCKTSLNIELHHFQIKIIPLWLIPGTKVFKDLIL